MELALGGAVVVDMDRGCHVKHLWHFKLITYVGFYIYASAKHWNYTFVLEHLSYCLVELHLLLFNMIGGLILIMSRLQAVILRVWILGVWQIGIRAIGYSEHGFNKGKMFLLKPDYNLYSAQRSTTTFRSTCKTQHSRWYGLCFIAYLLVT